MELRKTFTENLKKYRKENYLSQMKLAEMCDTATSYIGEIEVGLKFPSIEMLEKISNALHTPVYKFFMDNAGQNPKELQYQQRQQLIARLQKAAEEIVISEFPFSCDTEK